MKRIRLSYFPLFILGSCISTVVASPTSADFEDCHKQASSSLLYCLNETPGIVNEACWLNSKKINATCYTNTIQYYATPNKEKIEAKIKAEASKKAMQDQGVKP